MALSDPTEFFYDFPSFISCLILIFESKLSGKPS